MHPHSDTLLWAVSVGITNFAAISDKLFVPSYLCQAMCAKLFVSSFAFEFSDHTLRLKVAEL
jgi:hypothetical protein